MKVDFVKSLIALIISALLAYTCYEICKFEELKWVITIGSLLTIAIPLLLALGISSKDERGGLSLKAISWVMMLIEISTNAIFAFLDFSIPTYIIINGLLLAIFALIYNSIYKAHM